MKKFLLCTLLTMLSSFCFAQAPNVGSSFSEFGIFFIIVVILIIVFIICREFMCWYWKINKSIQNQEKIIDILNKNKGKHTFEYYMLLGEKEQAFLHVKNNMVNQLTTMRANYVNDKRFISDANELFPKYIKKMETTGYEIPEHLLSVDNFIKYQDSILEIED